MEFKNISSDLTKRNDTEGDYLSEEKKYFESLESVLFENALTHKKILFDHEFLGNYSAIKRSIFYSDEKSMNSVLLKVDSILGKKMRRWDYEFYFSGNDNFKEKMKENLNKIEIQKL